MIKKWYIFFCKIGKMMYRIELKRFKLRVSQNC